MPEASLLQEFWNQPMNLMLLQNSGIKLCESYNRQYGVSHGIDYRSVMPVICMVLRQIP